MQKKSIINSTVSHRVSVGYKYSKFLQMLKRFKSIALKFLIKTNQNPTHTESMRHTAKMQAQVFGKALVLHKRGFENEFPTSPPKAFMSQASNFNNPPKIHKEPRQYLLTFGSLVLGFERGAP